MATDAIIDDMTVAVSGSPQVYPTRLTLSSEPRLQLQLHLKQSEGISESRLGNHQGTLLFVARDMGKRHQGSWRW